MNISEAKNEVKNAIRIYLSKDANGNYEVPVEPSSYSLALYLI